MAFLKVMSGKQKGEKFTIDRDETTIGRAPDNAIFLDDESISGKHCTISRSGRRFTITDLGSTNGTRLNSVRVSSYRLSAKDKLSVGSVEITFDGDDIEDDQSAQIPPTIISEPKQASPGQSSEVESGSPAFARKQNSKGLWIVVTAAAGILAVIALIWFVKSLMN